MAIITSLARSNGMNRQLVIHYKLSFFRFLPLPKLNILDVLNSIEVHRVQSRRLDSTRIINDGLKYKLVRLILRKF